MSDPVKEEEKREAAASAPPPVSSPPGTLASPASSSSRENRTFSQLMAGVMASPAASPRGAPMVHLPVVAVPYFLAPAGIMETPGFAGQIAMTHQAVLATVTAQAHMQLQAAYPPSSEAVVGPFSHSASVDPTPLQQKPPSVPENNISTPETVQPPPSEQKSQTTQSVAKTSSYDGYNWRKYGQKQVKSGDRSRSYYRCTNINCSAKKKVERCPDGQETEIIYRGEHNHDPPQKMKSMEEKGVQSVGPSGENETLDLPSSEVYESEPLTSKADHNSGNGTPERQLFCSSDCEGDAAVNTKEENANEPNPKRRLIETQSTVPYSAPILKMIKEPKIVVHNAFDAAHIGDGYRWRKYGQKIVKGNPNPRSYYRCTHSGCPVRKHVERASDDAKNVVITYEGNHNHDQPPIKSGSDQRNPAATSVTKDVQSHTSDSLVDNGPPTETNKEFSGDKASEHGEERALDSAQALLSIGCNSTSGEKASGTNSDGVNRSLFTENCAAVPVQNS